MFSERSPERNSTQLRGLDVVKHAFANGPIMGQLVQTGSFRTSQKMMFLS